MVLERKKLRVHGSDIGEVGSVADEDASVSGCKQGHLERI